MNPWDPPDKPAWMALTPLSSPTSPLDNEILKASMATQPPPTAAPEKAPLVRLRETTLQGKKLLSRKLEPGASVSWLRRVGHALAAMYGPEIPICKMLTTEIQLHSTSGLTAAQLTQRIEGLESFLDHVESLGSQPLSCACSQASRPPATKDVFIIHGHDELNTRRLEGLLRSRFNLNPIAMLAKPGMSRPLTDKFEDEAGTCSFAFALFTPDDQITKSGKTYSQARPNVIYEVGWFIGRLGKQRVALILKHGTEIHSDLHGVSQIRFADNVEHSYLEIEKELQAAKLA